MVCKYDMKILIVLSTIFTEVILISLAASTEYDIESSLDDFDWMLDVLNNDDSCKDRMRGCHIIKQRNMCGRPKMDARCKKTCGYCGSLACTDKLSSCPRLKKMGFCEKRKVFMKVKCISSCDFCPKPKKPVPVKKPSATGCKNNWPTKRCEYYRHIGWCEKTGEIKTNCHETCVCSYHSAGGSKGGSCQTSKYGCCFDKKTIKTDNAGSNCPECKDDPRFEVLCDRFGGDCEGSGQLAKSLKRYCFKTCHLC